MSDMPERSEDDFNPATMADDVIYVGARKYVASDLPPTREQIMADERVQALVEAAEELHNKAVEKHQRGRSDIWPVIRKLRAALAALTESP